MNWVVEKRWFVLDNTGISYYKDKKQVVEKSPLGHLPLNNLKITVNK